MTDTTGQITGLIPTVLAIGILNKTTESMLGKPKRKALVVFRKK